MALTNTGRSLGVCKTLPVLPRHNPLCPCPCGVRARATLLQEGSFSVRRAKVELRGGVRYRTYAGGLPREPCVQEQASELVRETPLHSRENSRRCLRTSVNDQYRYFLP